jgi:hypothetical protein
VSHEELESLLGAYALDALDPDEEVLLEAHLAECPRCRTEVAAHRETAAALGNTGGQAPSGVWERIAAELDAGRPATQTPPTPSSVIPLPLRRQLALPVLAVLAAAALVVVALLAVSTIRLQHRVDALRSTESAGGLQQAAAAAVLDPHHTTAHLTSANGRFSAEVIIGPAGDAYWVNSDLPALDPLHTYQMWGLDNGQIVSLGLLGPHPQVAAFHVDSAVSRLMVTAEPKGGRPQPDTNVLISANRTT